MKGRLIFNPKAGAMVTGVRFPLVAFNVNLRTTDVTIAERIAKAVRHINGGYPLRAGDGPGAGGQGHGAGIHEPGELRQNAHPAGAGDGPQRSPALRRAASRAAELVGPVPMEALEEVVKYYLQAHEFKMEQIIENALLD